MLLRFHVQRLPELSLNEGLTLLHRIAQPGHCGTATHHRFRVLLTSCGDIGVQCEEPVPPAGFQDPPSESATLTHLLTEKFLKATCSLLIVASYTLKKNGVRSAPARAVGHEIVDHCAVRHMSPR